MDRQNGTKQNKTLQQHYITLQDKQENKTLQQDNKYITYILGPTVPCPPTLFRFTSRITVIHYAHPQYIHSISVRYKLSETRTGF